MYISSLSLSNFRNYSSEKIEFSPYTNVIYGDNAQGKTNILESVYIFSQGRSHRAKSDRELIKFGSDFAALSLAFHDSERDYNAAIQMVKNGRKNIKINHVQITKLSMLMNYLNVVMFSPEDMELVKGSPSSRRRFIDSSVSQLYPRYLSSLIDYHKALVQKNSLLKDLKAKGAKSDIMLSVWNEQLAAEGAKIMEYRMEFVKLINSFASEIQREISGEELKISYMPGIKTEQTDKNEIFLYLERNQRREIEFASAQVGVQRDDLRISVNGTEAKVYGSQGQQRTAALSMKIAQADYIHHIKGEYPVLLLDDIMSELDINRRMYLSQKIRGKQVLITSTDTDLIKSTEFSKLLHIKDGAVIREDG
ncbi:MAG: DNA replication/repair protein RecF [Oscillospiraceae bacterium]|nr:DNA replication/repair protein RecF [Oscillospiraceae bacterium]